ncbi:JAB domain-containing protein [Vibrio sp. PNB22_3_1]
MLYVKNETALKGAFEIREASPVEILGALSDEQVLDRANAIYKERCITRGVKIEDVDSMHALINTVLASRDTERFVILLFDNQHRFLDMQVIAEGTINTATIHVREVVKTAINSQANAVAFAHNHPSLEKSPSASDQAITRKLVNALELIEVRVLDHFIIGGAFDEPYSFAKNGLM